MLNRIELPGAVGFGNVCPYCSKVYPEHDNEKDEPLQTPDKCRRCSSPMDIKASKVFADEQAEAQQQPWTNKEAVLA